MKRLGILLFLLFCVTHLYAWEIDDFTVDIEVNQDSSFIVSEKILADFSDRPKHGILRNIPIRYQDESGKSINLDFQIIGIYDENGNNWQYSQSSSGVYRVLKIGSPHVTYNAQKTFVIKYKVSGAILFLENHDELYWNAIGTEWDAPINQVTVNVRLPQPVEKEYLATACYTGRFAARSSNVETTILNEREITFKGGRYLPYEGMTIVVGWPKGVVEVPPVPARHDYVPEAHSQYRPYASPSDSIVELGWLIFFIPLIIPGIVFLIMFNIWKRHGKDPKLQKSVVVEYQPPEGIRPAEMGTLIDDNINLRDMSSTIIDLAVRGYLKIIKKDALFFHKNFSFLLLKEYRADQSLNPYERIVLEGLFSRVNVGDSVKLSDLENNFYTKLASIKQDIFAELIKRGYYRSNPEKTVIFYRVVGIVVGFFAVFTLVFIPLGVALGLSAAIILCFAKYMPAKTRKGMDAYGKILGFEEFLIRTEKDKIKYEEQQGVFEKMLPYAICLGISSKWAMIFGDLYNRPPEWYAADFGRGFSMESFVRDLNHSMTSINYSLSSMPRTVSSGGGFGSGGSSGGGFGGGGGSSW